MIFKKTINRKTFDSESNFYIASIILSVVLNFLVAFHALFAVVNLIIVVFLIIYYFKYFYTEQRNKTVQTAYIISLIFCNSFSIFLLLLLAIAFLMAFSGLIDMDSLLKSL